MKEQFKETKLYTNHLIVFESDQVKFVLSSIPEGKWIIKRINSHIVSMHSTISYTNNIVLLYMPIIT